MRILFLHQNFPGQFPHIASHLAKTNQVLSISQPQANGLHGVQNITYTPSRDVTKGIHHYLINTEQSILNGQAVARTMQALNNRGFVPDVVIGHSGWGETLYVKDVFPNTKLISYMEFFYRATGADTGFDPEYPNKPDDLLRIRTKNTINLLSLDGCDAAISPTQWQKSQYPCEYQSKILMINEGVNRLVKPNLDATVTLPNGVVLTKNNKVVTYVARNLEPYRGFHQLMRAVEIICQRHPDCHVVIVGGDGVSYGQQQITSYKVQMLNEVSIDSRQVHFLGRLPYDEYLKVLQISSAHVYLTVPFILSWSMLEAMAVGCLVIGSDTQPVREVITHNENGLLVDFFSPSGIADAVDVALSNKPKLTTIRESAMSYVNKSYSVDQSINLYLQLIEKLTNVSK